MINKRLLTYAQNSKKFVFLQVACNLGVLITKIIMIMLFANLVQNLFFGKEQLFSFWISQLGVIALCLLIRYELNETASSFSYYATETITTNLRKEFFQQLLANKTDEMKRSDLVLLASHGIDIVEIYLCKYLPKLFYNLSATLLLFIVLLPIDALAAFLLLLFVFLAPLTLLFAQFLLKKFPLKTHYQPWDKELEFQKNIKSVQLSKDCSTENESLKENNQKELKSNSSFIKNLLWNLIPLGVMDIVAFVGVAIATITVIQHFTTGSITIGQMFIFFLIAGEFLYMMRSLGSYSHYAVRGNLVSNEVLDFLEAPQSVGENIDLAKKAYPLIIKKLSFGFHKSKDLLTNINLETSKRGLYALIGKDESGKSTLLRCIYGDYAYHGNISFGTVEVTDISSKSKYQLMTIVSDQSNPFRETVEGCLLDANVQASEEEMLSVLEEVQLKDFVLEHGGLSMIIDENQITRGQKQRLLLARALLHNTPVYLFDDVAKGVDLQSKEIITSVIKLLAKQALVFMASDDLDQIVSSKCIFLLENGEIVGSDTHKELMANNKTYQTMFESYMNNGGEDHE